MKIRGEVPRRIEFVAMGHVAVDLLDGQRVLGGAAAYACLAAARLGRASVMVTAFGPDFDLLEPLEGIEIHYHLSHESTAFRNQYRGAERQQHILGRARPLTERDLSPVRARLAERATVFYCPIAREVEAPLIPLEPGGLCGVAPQGFFRSWGDDGAIHQSSWKEAAAALAEATFISMSESDAPRARELALELTRGDRIVAVTQGGRGARLYTAGRCFRVPAWRSPELEPTGAGDVFAACFLIALGEGRAPLDAAQFATSAASFAVGGPGVEGVFKNRSQVDARLADYRSRYHPAEIDP